MASLRKLKKAFYRAHAAWKKDQRFIKRLARRIERHSLAKLIRIDVAYRAERVRRGLSDHNPCIVDRRKVKVCRG